MRHDQDEFTDDSENIALLKQPPQEPHSEQRQLFDERCHDNRQPRNKTQQMPAGKKFILKADDTSPRSTGSHKLQRFRKPCMFGLLCTASAILALSWLSTEDEYIASILALAFMVVFALCLLYASVMLIIRLSIAHRKEEWNTYILIISIEKGSFYIIDESSHENWEISGTTTLDQLNMSIKNSPNKSDEAFVMIDQTQFNLKPVRYEEARKFVLSIDEYLKEIWRKQYIEEQYNKGDVLAMVDANGDEYDMQALEINLQGFISGLVNDENVVKHMDGQRLNRWYEREHVKPELLQEYKALVKARDAEKRRFEKYINFEPRFDEDYIARMLLVKCSVFEILSD
eukprot:CAMPEP_0197022764 /NCGR_PEP_ID=MMETSP1384-20130603/3585_1 /TAXON_ID=29189 /ORGANISM="Ammonia sp." /LENGTH=342 /DNA_ID=CAMNT_0042450863 /DNA_START=21 /DNA_END=1049 /DNA_ORIENTATION=-